MNDWPRWSIDELMSRYELEPTLADIYVEGSFDKDIFTYIFQNTKQNVRICYTIDCVEITSELLLTYGLTTGNKQRVIALAHELAKVVSDCSYRCIVDRDMDHWFGDLDNIPRLIWHNYCSIELYFLTEEILHDILITTTKAKIGNWRLFYDSFITCLRNIYILRLVDRELKLSIDWIEFNRCLIKHNDSIEFSLSQYINRLLLKNKLIGVKERFETSVAKWNSLINGDPRLFIRGHDYIYLISWVVEKYNGVKTFTTPISIERILILLSLKVSELLSLVN